MKIAEFVGVLVILLIFFILFSLVMYVTVNVSSVLHNPVFTSIVLITMVLLFLSLMLCIAVLVLYCMEKKDISPFKIRRMLEKILSYLKHFHIWWLVWSSYLTKKR